MLARIFARPCNVLIMDEPTNKSHDLETLDLLEEMLQTFPGTVIVISHDRRFIDHFATETWVFDGSGNIETIVGGWSDVEAYYRRIGKNVSLVVSGKLAQNEAAQEAKAAKADDAQASTTDKATESAAPAKKANKLSFTEAHELEDLPDHISKLEEELAAIDARMADPALYTQGPDAIKEVNQQRTDMQAKLDALRAFWRSCLSKSEG